MTKNEFLEAKNFIYSDIEREIKWAKFWENKLFKFFGKLIGLPHGGGNFLAALGLLCYTEFAGKLKYNTGTASGNFNRFFDDMSPNYQSFRASFTDPKFVYDTFRCGLAHEFYIKKSSTIVMFTGKATMGVGIINANYYFFSVEKYFQDFKIAFEALERHLYPPTNP